METVAVIQKAVDFIEDYLSDELAMADIAKHVAYSPWHFQRVFRGVTGNSLKEYIRKRRLTHAMEQLVGTQTRIIDIAIAHGFDCQESFTRAFKKMFGVNPGECRKTNPTGVKGLLKPRIDLDYIQHLYGELVMRPEIKNFKERHFVGMDTNFICMLSPDRNNHIVIPELWGRYMQRRDAIKNVVGAAEYGLCEAIPEEKKQHQAEFHYIACAEVTEPREVPADMISYTVPAGRYAVFTHRGKLERLAGTMDQIFGHWLPQSGEQLRDAADVEVYGAKFDPMSDESEMEYCIPLQ